MIQFYRDQTKTYNVRNTSILNAQETLNCGLIARFISQCGFTSPLITAHNITEQHRSHNIEPWPAHAVVKELRIFISGMLPALPFAYVQMADNRLKFIFLPLQNDIKEEIHYEPFAGDNLSYTEDILTLNFYAKLYQTLADMKITRRVKRSNGTGTGTAGSSQGRRLIFLESDLLSHYVSLNNPHYTDDSFHEVIYEASQLYEKTTQLLDFYRKNQFIPQSPLLIKYFNNQHAEFNDDYARLKADVDSGLDLWHKPSTVSFPPFNTIWPDQQQAFRNRHIQRQEQSLKFMNSFLALSKQTAEKLKVQIKNRFNQPDEKRQKDLVSKISGEFNEKYLKLANDFYSPFFNFLKQHSGDMSLFLTDRELLNEKIRSRYYFFKARPDFILYSNSGNTIKNFSGDIYFLNHGIAKWNQAYHANVYIDKIIKTFDYTGQTRSLGEIKNIYFLNCYAHKDFATYMVNKLARAVKDNYPQQAFPLTINCYMMPFFSIADSRLPELTTGDGRTYHAITQHFTVPPFLLKFTQMEKILIQQLADFEQPLEFEFSQGNTTLRDSLTASDILKKHTISTNLDDNAYIKLKEDLDNGQTLYTNTQRTLSSYMNEEQANEFIENIIDNFKLPGVTSASSYLDIMSNLNMFIHALRLELMNQPLNTALDKLTHMLDSVAVFPKSETDLGFMAKALHNIKRGRWYLRPPMPDRLIEHEIHAIYNKITDRIVTTPEAYRDAYGIDIRLFARTLAGADPQSQAQLEQSIVNHISNQKNFYENAFDTAYQAVFNRKHSRVGSSYTFPIEKAGTLLTPETTWTRSELSEQVMTDEVTRRVHELTAKKQPATRQRLVNEIDQLNRIKAATDPRHIPVPGFYGYMQKTIFKTGSFLSYYGLVQGVAHSSYRFRLTDDSAENFQSISGTLMFYKLTTDKGLDIIRWTFTLKSIERLRSAATVLRFARFIETAGKISAGLDLLLAPAIIYTDVSFIKISKTAGELALSAILITVDISATFASATLMIIGLSGSLLVFTVFLGIVSFVLNSIFTSFFMPDIILHELEENIEKSYHKYLDDFKAAWIIGPQWTQRHTVSKGDERDARGFNHTNYAILSRVNNTYRILDMSSFIWDNAIYDPVLISNIDDIEMPRPYYRASSEKDMKGGIVFMPRPIPGGSTYDFSRCSDPVTYLFNTLSPLDTTESITLYEQSYRQTPLPTTINLAKGLNTLIFYPWDIDKADKNAQEGGQGILNALPYVYKTSEKMEYMFGEKNPVLTYNLMGDNKRELALDFSNLTQKNFSLNLNSPAAVRQIDLSHTEARLKLTFAHVNNIKRVALPKHSRVVTSKYAIVINSAGESAIEVTEADNKVFIQAGRRDIIKTYASDKNIAQHIVVAV
jgi:hypothetical protein